LLSAAEHVLSDEDSDEDLQLLLARGDADAIVGTGERQARRIVAALVEVGVIGSVNPRAPLRLVFPAALAGRWMPGLFPEQQP
jgi:hypothetical protein